MSIYALKTSLSRAYTYASETTQRAYSRGMRVARSAIGRFAVNGIVENVAEFAGFYLGSLAGSEIGKKVGRYIGIRTAELVPIAGGCLAGSIAEVVRKKLNKSALVSLAVATSSLASLYLTLPWYQEMVAQVGEDLGEFCTSWTLGILAAYCAIKASGSSEILHGESFYQTYVGKTIVSSVGVWALNQRGMITSNDMIRIPIEFGLGSLFYNIFDISDVLRSVFYGRLLDGYLFHRVPEFAVNVDLSQIVLSASSSNLFLAPERVVLQKAEHFLNQMVSSDPFWNALTNELLCAMNVKTLIAQNMPFDSSQFIQNNLKDYSISKTFNQSERSLSFAVLARSINFYSDFLKHNQVKIVDRIQDFTTKFIEFLENHNYPIVHQIPRIHELSMNLDQINRAAPLYKNCSNQAADRILNLVLSREERIFGFCFGNVQSRKEHLVNHLEQLLVCSSFLLPSAAVPLAEQEIRNFYSNLYSLAVEHYSFSVSGKMLHLLESSIQHQISYSELPN